MKITNAGRGIHQREIPGLEKLKELPDNWHGFTNLDLALPGRGVREIDLVMVIEDRLLLVDLKDWFGPVTSRDGNWFNGKRDCGRSPVHKIAENVRELLPLLRKFLIDQEKQRRGFAQKTVVPLIEGVVVLTRENNRNGISGSEVSRVFSVAPFMQMLKSRAERETQLSISRVRDVDFTSTEWIERFRRFFNTSTGIFQVGARRYGGFKATNESPTFFHRAAIFSEFDVEEEGVDMSFGLLRRWDFTKAETRFQSEEGRASIAGREKSVIAWLDDRNPNCGSSLFKPKVDDQDRGVAYWEVFERRRRTKRLSEFIATDFHRTTPGERIELARQTLASAKTIHDLQAAHLDIGLHSIWLERPTTVRFSHLMAASLPQIESLGSSRFQFLSSCSAPEDVLGDTVIPLRKDVFLLGCAIHALLFGAPPTGDPPLWDAAVDSGGVFALLHPWFERCLDIDLHQRFGSASEMLDAFNAALSAVPDARATVEGLDRYRTLTQRQVFHTYPESKLLLEDNRVVIWRTDTSSSQRIVKLWKVTALGNLSKEASRILTFLERAEALIESPIPGTAAFRNVHWTGDAIVLVQDFIVGPTLFDEMTSHCLLSSPEYIVDFFLELIDTVGILHDRSLSHGDLKPENIVVTSSLDAGKSLPILIDLLELVPSLDGERLSRAYAPPSGGRFERDRFAVTKMLEEIVGLEQINGEGWADVRCAIDKCRSGPPANATLLPLKEALRRVACPAVQVEPPCPISVSLQSAPDGPMFSDEGEYWISRSGSTVHVRGAIEQLVVRLDSEGWPVRGRREKLSQSAIQRARHSEFASFVGQVIVKRGMNELAAIAEILRRPEIVAAWARHTETARPDANDDTELDKVLTEAQEDEIAERLLDAPAETSFFNIHQLWRRMLDLEAELTIEAACLGDSTFRRNTKRHLVPVQMTAGEFDFDRNDTVTVERQDDKGRWSKIGLLDISASTADFIAFESWMWSKQELVADGSRLRFQSRFENTSRERREAATSRILQRAAAAPALFDVFQPTATSTPRRVSCEINEADVSQRYGLNPVQIAAFRNILECRPVGLLQGPPGTGKTRFIGALIHYALTHGLATNVLLASQSHEAVNNAGEAVLNLFGVDRDSLSFIRVGHEGSVSESLRPYHAACVEKAYKDQFSATIRARLNVVATAIGLDHGVSERVIFFEDAVRPVLARINELSADSSGDLSKLHSLKATVEQQLASQGIDTDLSESEAEAVENAVTTIFMSALPRTQTANIEKFRRVAQLSRDIVGSVSTWQRSFETFLAGTRQVVAGTCVGLGRTSLGLTKTVFDLVIVDEAARCTSSELAVPIQAGKWVVLVGDQAQLEPLHSAKVVQSVADELCIPLHEVVRSDFERVFESTYGKAAGSTLTKQYRMLPPIGRVVSSAFYGRGLAHGRTETFLDQAAMPPELSKPLAWVSTDSLGQNAYQKPDKVRRGSLFNMVEADAILTLLKRWSTHEPFVTALASQPPQTQAIGVICAYAAQRDLVWKKIQAENLPDAVRRSLKVDTIDNYQGKQNLIVMLSLVRNNADGVPEGGVATIAPGFMARKNRVNVALSRAMDRLVIIGARSRWRRGTPLAKIVEAVTEELKCDEAIVIDAHELFDASSTVARPKKQAAVSPGRNTRPEAAQ
jgi:serine/threonine protein kinase